MQVCPLSDCFPDQERAGQCCDAALWLDSGTRDFLDFGEALDGKPGVRRYAGPQFQSTAIPMSPPPPKKNPAPVCTAEVPTAPLKEP